ncbi:MAG: hypothetical protein DMF88_02670 [Acidobacteria bacterium]|nr:MAG: hypothetical protein DMF88_02670 [Acidobacteriota bacterium]
MPPSRAQEASIIGQVTDDTGAVLPGVTVIATSPALQVKQVVDVTNERGEYRLTPLPLGTYSVEYTLEGFQSVRRADLRLTAGFTAKVDIVLKVSALAETITVSGEAPLVDVTSTTATTQLTRETLEVIPTGRNSIVALMIQAPGARPQLDWSFVTGNPQFKVFGELGEQWVAMEGVVTSGPKTGTQGGNHYRADQGSADQRDPEVGRRSVPRQRRLLWHQSPSGIRQRQRHAARARHYRRQPGERALGRERRAGRTDRPQQAVVLLLDAPARGEGADVQRLPRRWRDAVRVRHVPVLPHGKDLVSDEPVEQVHRLRAVRASGRREHEQSVLVV